MNIGYKANVFEQTDRLLIPVSDPQPLTIPTYDTSGQACHPSVVYISGAFAGYKYWMAMTPYPDSNNDYENPSLIASNDGITWVVPDGVTNPIVAALEGEGYNRDPMLLYDVTNNQLRMYWGDSTNKTYYVTISSSLVISAATEITSTWTGQPAIIRNSATDWVGWTGNTTDVRVTSLTRRTSADGETWVKQLPTKTNLYNSRIWHTDVFSDQVGLHFLVSAYPSGRDTEKCLIYGFSPDGGDNVIFDSTPLLMRESSGALSGLVYKSSMVAIGGQRYRVYVSAMNLDGTWSMLYFDAKLNNPFAKMNAAISPKIKTQNRLLFNAIEIRDSNVHMGTGDNGNALDEFNEYANKILLVYNTLDKAVVLAMRSDMRAAGSYDELAHGTTNQECSVNASLTYAPTLINSTNVAVLGMIVPWRVGISAKCTEAPTTGSLTVWLCAW